MVSALDKAKRALVALINSPPLLYECRVKVTRESKDKGMLTLTGAQSKVIQHAGHILIC